MKRKPQKGDKITDSEANVLCELVRDGGTNSVIGKQLVLSPDTIKHYLSSAGIKSDCRNRTSLALWWIRKGRYEYLESKGRT